MLQGTNQGQRTSVGTQEIQFIGQMAQQQLNLIQTSTILPNLTTSPDILSNGSKKLNEDFSITQAYVVHRTVQIDPNEQPLTFSDHRGLFLTFCIKGSNYSIYYHSLNSCIMYNAQKLTEKASELDKQRFNPKPLDWTKDQNQIGLCLLENIKNLSYPDFIVLGECSTRLDRSSNGNYSEYGIDVINVIITGLPFIYGISNPVPVIENFPPSGITCIQKKIPNSSVPNLEANFHQVASTSLGLPQIIKLDKENCWIFCLHWHNKYARATEEKVINEAKFFFNNAFAEVQKVPEIIIMIGDTNMLYKTDLPNPFAIKINNSYYAYQVHSTGETSMRTSSAVGEVLDRIYVFYNPTKV